MSRTAVAAAAVACTAGIGVLGTARPHVEGPPPGHTGGFGEPTCTACHADASVNDGIGRLRVIGLPAVFEPEREYALVVRLARPDLARAGFQLAVRFDVGGPAGTQAGSIAAADSAVQILADGSRGVQYAEHTSLGVATATDTISWTVLWRAPSNATVPIVLHVAANASNDDDSELGDAVYTLEQRVAPP